MWHQFVIRVKKREEIITYLKKNKINTNVHYPIPSYLSEAYQCLNIKEGSFPLCEEYAKTVLSLPLYNGMTDEEQTYVIDKINQFE